MKVWAEETLGDLCSLITDGKHGDCRNEDNSGYYFISCKDVREGRIHYENVRQIVHEDFVETHRRTDLRPGDVLLTNSGTIGRLAIAPNDEKTQRTTFQKSVAILKPLPETITSQFLYYSLAVNRDGLINSAGGAAQKNLLLGELRRFPIRVPSIAKQAEIASILSAYDDLIENNRRRIQLLEDSARLLYREWFVGLSFPGHEHVKIIDGVPEGWKKSTVSKLGDVVTGKTPSTKDPDNFGGKIPFIKTPDMHKNPIIIETLQYLSEKGANSQAKKYIPEDSIMVSCIGTVGIVAINAIKAQTNQQINTVIPPKEHFRYYTYFALGDLKSRLEAMGGGATMVNVNKGKFESLPIVIPSDSTLQEFHEVCNPIFLQIKNLLIQNQRLKTARDLLLPRLMNGEIEV